MRIALAQLNYTLNDFEGNLARMKSAVDRSADADLVVFSELALSGYFPQDLIEEPSFLPAQETALAELIKYTASSGKSVAVGLVTKNPGAGRQFRNSLVIARGGAIVGTYHKQLLPDYGVFDERRHFEPGPAEPLVVQIGCERVGFLICEDAWNSDGANYTVDPVAAVMAGNISLLVTINASPSDVGKRAQRHDMLARQAKKHWVPIAYVNQVGGNDSLIFDGGSFFMQAGGSLAVQAPVFEEAVAIAEFRQGSWVPSASTEDGDEPSISDSEFYYRQLVLGMRDYMRKTGFKTAVVGSSGGIDSAVVLALAVAAIGPENVFAITMPSQYSSGGSVTDSEALCANLGVRLYTHPIKTLVAQFGEDFLGAFGSTPAGLTAENVQARIRGVILMEFSNQFGSLLLTTGNKSEISVGYSTLYGDMAGGLNPIGDLYKMEVYELANYLNSRDGQAIPDSILTKAPSAELAPGQTDEAALLPYPILDEILKWHIEGPHLRSAELEKAYSVVAEMGLTGRGEEVSRILGLVANAEFKRRQAAPILRVRARSFGSGRQVPIAIKPSR